MKAESSVTCELRLRLLVAGDAALPVPAALRYDLADPYAIHATFHAAGDTVEERVEPVLRLQHPRRADAYVAVARLDGRCLATSGDYSTAFDEARHSHHIFDPATGRDTRVDVGSHCGTVVPRRTSVPGSACSARAAIGTSF